MPWHCDRRHDPGCWHHRDARALVRVSYGCPCRDWPGWARCSRIAAVTAPSRDCSGRTPARIVTPTHPRRVKPGTHVAGIVAIFAGPPIRGIDGKVDVRDPSCGHLATRAAWEFSSDRDGR